MAEIKTKPTEVTVEDFLDRVEPAAKREDGKVLDALFRKVTAEKPKMWGPTIVGYGQYHYKYASGHEGDMCRMGFSPRDRELVVYLVPELLATAEARSRLGRHRTGKSCLYIKKLSDVDETVLEEMAAESLAWMNEKYPEGA